MDGGHDMRAVMEAGLLFELVRGAVDDHLAPVNAPHPAEHIFLATTCMIFLLLFQPNVALGLIVIKGIQLMTDAAENMGRIGWHR